MIALRLSLAAAYHLLARDLWVFWFWLPSSKGIAINTLMATSNEQMELQMTVPDPVDEWKKCLLKKLSSQ